MTMDFILPKSDMPPAIHAGSRCNSHLCWTTTAHNLPTSYR
ncbi:hypothetical protein [Sodalis glossinidius]